MPVISCASSKGGAGKTTSIVLLAGELARQGLNKNIKVALIDADPNQHSAAWAKLEGVPSNIVLYENVTEDTILDVIELAQTQAQFVLVDLEGVASSAVVGAVSSSDLVIIPCQASQNDAKEAIKTVKTIRYASRIAKRNIPFSVLFVRTQAAIITKTSKYLTDSFTEAGIDIFKSALVDREAFRNIFSFGGTVNSVQAKSKKEQESLDKAANNVQSLVLEVKQLLKANLGEVK
ncbi:ParA family protein [Shewanella sp. SM23]|uniref:ParA family protein n=1 Tax=Shewanella sp. SM23 TaxID=2912794 RepID=UPI0021D96B4C|nr:ParA family protein [Shewanella sp. SM23]MCU8085355.1 ParA family protein [Shewanella sp. SM23]